MTLQELSCFLEVARELNFSKAAEKLYISQPAVSKYIHRLEEELGIRLLDRSVRRAVMLTPAGGILKDCLQRCEEEFSSGMEQIALLKQSAAVTVNLMEDCNLPEVMMRRFADFFALPIPVEVNFEFLSYEKIETSVERGELVICTAEAVPEHLKCKVQSLASAKVSYHMLVSVQHPAFQGTDSPALSEFAGYPLFLPRTMPEKMRELLIKMAEKAVGARPQLKLLNSTDGVIFYLRGHIGYTIVTEWFKNFQDQDFYALPLGESTEYVLLWNPQKVEHEGVRQMIRMLGNTSGKYFGGGR